MLNKFNNMENSKKISIVIAFSVIVIIFVSIFSYYKSQNAGYKYLKKDNKKALVYTIKSSENSVFHIEVPYLNIKDSFADEINKDIEEYTLEYTDNKRLMLSYQYNINDYILSLVIKVVDYDTNVPKSYFKTYNIDLKNKKLLDDTILLSNYNVSVDDVSSKIENQFTDWYQDITKKGYFDERECDYECFLEYREVDNYLDDISYYIENGKLVAYKPFVFYSIYGEEEYFKENDFKFIIVNRES